MSEGLTPPLPSWNTVSMPIDTQPPQNMPQPILEPASPNPPKPRNFWKILLISITVIVIITTAGAGILIFSQLKSITETNNSKSSQSSPLDNPLILKMVEKLPIPKITFVPITLAPTTPLSQTNPQSTSTPYRPTMQPSDWKTYNNISFNFSLSYPQELTTQENSHGLGVTDISFTNPNSNPQNAPKYQILIYPKTIGNLIGQSFEQFYNLPAQSTQLMTSEATTPQQFTKIKNTTINSLRAFNFRTTSDPPDPAEEAEIGTYIELGESTLIISTGESNQTILDHILSTFKSN